MRNLEKTDFIIQKGKKRTKKDLYLTNGTFSASEGIRIKLGNIYANILKEAEKDKENEYDEDFLTHYLEHKILEAIIHENLHKVTYILHKDSAKIDEYPMGIESDIIDELIDEL